MLPMIGGQSKSIGIIGLTNDMHIIIFIPKRNVTNCAFDIRSISNAMVHSTQTQGE